MQSDVTVRQRHKKQQMLFDVFTSFSQPLFHYEIR